MRKVKHVEDSHFGEVYMPNRKKAEADGSRLIELAKSVSALVKSPKRKQIPYQKIGEEVSNIVFFAHGNDLTGKTLGKAFAKLAAACDF